MINQQPIRKRVEHDGNELIVVGIFDTIQGEGPFSGRPATFIRLEGCNLQCPLCDTEYTAGALKLTVTEIAAMAQEDLVVITGGEPFRQPIGPLINVLIDKGHTVQVETNGTLPPPKHVDFSVHIRNPISGAYIVVSPKTGKVNPETEARACAFKYVISKNSVSSFDKLPVQALGHPVQKQVARPPEWWDRPVYVQPADEQDPDINAGNMRAAVSACRSKGYTLQLQIHKILGLE